MNRMLNNMNLRRNQNDQEKAQLSRQLKPLLTTLQILGIYFTKRSKLHSKCVAFCMKTLMCIAYIAKFIQAIYYFFYDDSPNDKIFSLSNHLLTSLHLILWISLTYKRKIISKMVLQVVKIHCIMRLKAEYLSKAGIALIISFLFTLNITMYVIMFLGLVETDKVSFYVQRIYINLLPLNMSKYLLPILITLDFAFFLILTSPSMYLDLLYAVICRILSTIVREFTMGFNNETYNILCDKHTCISETISFVDNCLSYPIFINLCLHVDLLYLDVQLIVKRSYGFGRLMMVSIKRL